jgi:Lrp/AsnC family leucine-responsive transcriptional regulator
MTKTNSGLDAIDRKILELYQRDTRVPAGRIGKKVGLSAAAVQRRIKRLRESRVIVAEVAELAPERVGHPVTCIVGVRMARESRAGNARFEVKMRRERNVQQCWSVTGEFDYMLVVLTSSIEAFNAFAAEALYSDDNVKGFTTFVSLGRVKTGLLTPILP